MPAGNDAPFDVNALSATFTGPPVFHGSTAERQSPRCLTSSTPPAPLSLPATTASVPNGCIGFVKTLESAIVYVVTCCSSSSVHPVSSYGAGSSGL